MKKIFLLICFILMSPIVLAADMGSYFDFGNAIYRYERSPQHEMCKKEIIKLSKTIIQSSNQTMAETIMFMLVESKIRNRPIFCVPNNFNLNSREIEKLIEEGFDRSTTPYDKKCSYPAAFFAISELSKKYPCRK